MKRPIGKINESEDAGGELSGSKATKRSKNMFQSRCNPKLNVALFQKHIDKPEFRRFVTEVGLDGLMHLRVTRLHRDLCVALARKVDVASKCLKVHGKDIPLTYASVTKVLSLPCYGSDEVPNTDLESDIQSTTCSRYNLDASGKVSFYSLLSFLEEATIFDEEFKAKFVLFTIATLLRPTTNVHLYYREYIPMISNMIYLKEFNWAKFLLDGLLDSITVFQVKGAKSLGGCLLYMQLVYLHCISPVTWRSSDQICIATFCLQSWTDERVSVVLKMMRAQGGLESNEVTVRTIGIPNNTVEDNPLLPQVLMHNLFIDRINRHLVDKENEFSVLLHQLKQLLELIQTRSGNTETLCFL